MKTIAIRLLGFCVAVFLPLAGMAAGGSGTSGDSSSGASGRAPGSSASSAAGSASGIAEIAETTAVVESVDVPNRLVTIKDESGAVQTLEVPPEVRNLPQLKAGDRIRARYKVAIATMIKPPGSSGGGITEQTESASSTPPGSKPGGMAQRQITTTIKVKAVDAAKNTLTFEGPRGLTRTVQVKDPSLQAELKKLKVGDDVQVVYTEALAIDVIPATS